MDTYSSRLGWTVIAYMLHVWNISLHLVYFYGKCVGKYSTHGVLWCTSGMQRMTKLIIYTIAPGQTLIFVGKQFGKPQGKFGSLEPFWPETPTEDIDFQNPQRVVSHSSIQDLWPCQVWCMKIICWCVWFSHFGTRSWNNLILCIVVVSYKSCKRTTNCYTRWAFFME